MDLPNVATDAVAVSFLVIPVVFVPHAFILEMRTSFWVSSCQLAAYHTPSVLLAWSGSICLICFSMPSGSFVHSVSFW